MVKRDVFIGVDGFDSPYWPGEDTFLCLKLLRAGHKVTYVPELIVWHHRREGLLRHMKQVGAYGLHRGYFARHLPETSRRIQYFFPSIVLLMFLSAPLTLLLPTFTRLLALVGICGYFFAVLIGIFDMMRFEKKKIAMAALPFVIATHISYGFSFVKGITMKRPLISKLR